jgi:HK97 family phage major capsid protein
LNKTWRDFIRGYQTEETRALLTSSDGAGGAVVAQEFSGFLSEALKYYCPLFFYANVRVRPNGRSVKVGRVSDTTHGLTLITEGSSTPVAEVDPGFSSSLVSTDLFTSGLTRFSNQLLSDSYFDLERLLTLLNSSRVGRGIETLITGGVDSSGTATPNNPGLINLAQTATTTATLSAGIGWADLIKTFDALDAGYLAKAIWLMSSKTRNYLAGLEDSTSRPYFIPAPNADSLDMLLGRPIVLNQSLALPTTASAMPILFGSLFDGLQIVSSEVRVQTLVERYAEVNESAIIVSTRVGSASLQAGAIQALKLAAA